ncbi:MAG: hypothetical protein PHE84_01460 [bacterium]|nr:hypothetical protein [bacterium]
MISATFPSLISTSVIAFSLFLTFGLLAAFWAGSDQFQMMLFQFKTVLPSHLVLEDVDGRVAELDPAAALGANQMIMMDTSKDVFIVCPAGLLAGPDLGSLNYPGFKKKGQIAVDGWERDLMTLIF